MKNFLRNFTVSLLIIIPFSYSHTISCSAAAVKTESKKIVCTACQKQFAHANKCLRHVLIEHEKVNSNDFAYGALYYAQANNLDLTKYGLIKYGQDNKKQKEEALQTPDSGGSAITRGSAKKSLRARKPADHKRKYLESESDGDEESDNAQDSQQSDVQSSSDFDQAAQSEEDSEDVHQPKKKRNKRQPQASKPRVKSVQVKKEEMEQSAATAASAAGANPIDHAAHNKLMVKREHAAPAKDMFAQAMAAGLAAAHVNQNGANPSSENPKGKPNAKAKSVRVKKEVMSRASAAGSAGSRRAIKPETAPKNKQHAAPATDIFAQAMAAGFAAAQAKQNSQNFRNRVRAHIRAPEQVQAIEQASSAAAAPSSAVNTTQAANVAQWQARLAAITVEMAAIRQQLGLDHEAIMGINQNQSAAGTGFPLS